jgi:hypothetical protein
LNPASTEPLWCAFNEFVSQGIRYRQAEQFFLIRADEREVVIGSEVQEARATEGIMASRWWSLEELRATNSRRNGAAFTRRLRHLSFQPPFKPVSDPQNPPTKL